MKKALILEKKELYYYHFGLKKIIDYRNKKTYPPYISGNISGGLSGNISGIRGCVDNIIGNLNDCDITEKEREKGIDIKDLARFSKI